MMIDSQLELGFGSTGRALVLTHRQRRLSRARWWFDRMRQVVDRAFEPTPPPRPQQMWMETADDGASNRFEGLNPVETNRKRLAICRGG